MNRPYTLISTDLCGSVTCVRLAKKELNDSDLQELGNEVARLVDEDGCRKIVLVLGPDDPKCLYSVFLAKLLNLQRRLQATGGGLALACLSETTRDLFHAAGLEPFFQFYPDTASALAALQ
ncbi:MAG: STAS domain-containing protein [Gemmataceae bacterium]|nr:STAS domain-containing protein [Gemmataceae bacterium]